MSSKVEVIQLMKLLSQMIVPSLLQSVITPNAGTEVFEQTV